jgi:hypothetical protein
MMRLLVAAVLSLFTGFAFGAVLFVANLSGANEAPPNASPGTGTALAIYDGTLHTLHAEAIFSGLLGPTSAAHIHCCTATPGVAPAGVATQVPSFVGFPLGVTSGSFSNTYDLTLETAGTGLHRGEWRNVGRSRKRRALGLDQGRRPSTFTALPRLPGRRDTRIPAGSRARDARAARPRAQRTRIAATRRSIAARSSPSSACLARARSVAMLGAKPRTERPRRTRETESRRNPCR